MSTALCASVSRLSKAGNGDNDSGYLITMSGRLKELTQGRGEDTAWDAEATSLTADRF